jgi:hypothetical protein
MLGVPALAVALPAALVTGAVAALPSPPAEVAVVAADVPVDDEPAPVLPALPAPEPLPL